MKRNVFLFLFLVLLQALNSVIAQTGDSILREATLQNCIQYALKKQPVINQSQIDEQVADRQIKSKLADWLPQLNLYANYQNSFILQSVPFAGQVINQGTYNTSTAQFSLTQTIFDRDVLLARTSAKDVRLQFKQFTISNKIDLVANVSKAFYDVLLSKKQIELLDQDIVLLERSEKDAYNQYRGGVVDKTDYQRATITLNNAKAQRKNSQEQLKSKYASLKLLMSYPATEELELSYDSAKLVNEVMAIDTTEQVNFENRIEYQLLKTQKKLLEDNLRYYKWGFLPSLTAFGQYNFNYFSDDFVKLYNNNFPYAYAGISLSFPIFQGTKRTQQIRIAQLELNRLEYNFISVKDSIVAQYTQVLASYKSNLVNYFVQKENLDLAKEVYNIIQLQYRSGVKTYLDVVTANNDLFSAQINYLEAAFQVLTNKIDVQRSLGTLQY